MSFYSDEHHDGCDCDACMEYLYSTRDQHSVDCWCVYCEDKRRAEINRSPAAIVYTDEALLEMWEKGGGIKPAYSTFTGRQVVEDEQLDGRIVGTIFVTEENRPPATNHQ